MGTAYSALGSDPCTPLCQAIKLGVSQSHQRRAGDLSRRLESHLCGCAAGSSGEGLLELLQHGGSLRMPSER